MKFNNWINNNKYVEYHRHAFVIIEGIVKKSTPYLLNYQEREDIISRVFEDLIVENSEITNEISFKYGKFLKFVRFKTLGYLNNKHKKKLDYCEKLSYHPVYRTFKEPEFLSKFDKYPKIKEIVEEKFINGEKWEIIEKKYNVCSKTINKQIKQIMEGNYKEKKPMKERVYEGVLCLNKEGQIVKAYPNISDTKKDGFVPSRIRQICKGLGNKKGFHKNYKWEFCNKTKENA